jgi:hypothetical protein
MLSGVKKCGICADRRGFGVGISPQGVKSYVRAVKLVQLGVARRKIR